MISPTRELPNAQGSVELRPAARAVAQHRARHPVCRLEHEPSRSQLLQQHAAPGEGAGPAASEPEVPQPPDDPERPDRRLRRDQHHPAQAHEPRHPGRCALHLVAAATWPRTRTAAARRWTTTTSGATTARELGHPHRFVASYLYDVPFLKDSERLKRGRRLAGLGRHDRAERVAGEHHDRRRPRQHRHHRPAAAGSRRRGALPELRPDPARRRS